MWFGATALALFGLLRVANWYGDPVHFERLGTGMQTAMSFFNVTKYPPSLQFLAATLGMLLLLFALIDKGLEDKWVPRALSMMEVYGRVPFFYYMLHLYLLHLLAVVILMVALHTVHVHPAIPIFRAAPMEASFRLRGVYVLWISVVAALYAPCRWFAGVKARRRDWWLSYL